MPIGMNENTFVQLAVESASNTCKVNLGHNFIQSLVACKQVELVKTKTEQKNEKDAIMICRVAFSAILMASTLTLFKEMSQWPVRIEKERLSFF